MRNRLIVAMGFCLAIAFTLSGMSVAAQEKPDRVEGTVQSIDTATNTVTVTLKAKTNTVQVIYSDKTVFTFRNKDSSVDEVKTGRRVICLGKLNDKNQLTATRIDVRDEG